MPKTATKAANNVFYKARMEAAKCSALFNSRESTSEATGIDRTRLAYIELDAINPHPEEVVILSEAYNAPELCNKFCSRVCPIGKKTINEVNADVLEQTVLQLLSISKSLPNIKDELISIALNGTIDKDEFEKMESILQSLEKASDSIQALRILFKKTMRRT